MMISPNFYSKWLKALYIKGYNRLMPTYTTILSPEISSFLDATDALYGRISLDMHVRMMRGDKQSVIEKALASKYGVGSTTVRNVWHNLKGAHRSIRALQIARQKDLKRSIVSIQKWIKARSKKLAKTKKKGKDTQRLRFTIHNKKRRLAIQQQKLDKLSAQVDAGYVSVAFGSKKLFNAQHHLEENGYANHEEWLADWRDARSGNFMMVGSKIYASGNQLCRLRSDGQLDITVPLPLMKEFGAKVSAEGVSFRYGQGWIDAALEPVRRVSEGKRRTSRIGTEKAVTHHFIRKGSEWYIHTYVELPEIPRRSHKRNGAIGVDLNAKSLEWAYCDKQGNLQQQGKIALDLAGKSSAQSEALISDAVGQVVTLASTYECPIVIEKLDFSAKKAGLREQGKRYAAMLSQFAYSKFGQFVKSKCYRSGIQAIEVNPAYSSLIGMAKYMAMYGLSSGTAAALVLARRCFRFSERLPQPVRTFLSPVDGRKHSWSHWARLSRSFKGVRRHSFYAMRVRVGAKLIGGHSLGTQYRKDGTLDSKLRSTPAIPSEAGALASRTMRKFTQLCLSF